MASGPSLVIVTRRRDGTVVLRRVLMGVGVRGVPDRGVLLTDSSCCLGSADLPERRRWMVDRVSISRPLQFEVQMWCSCWLEATELGSPGGDFAREVRDEKGERIELWNENLGGKLP